MITTLITDCDGVLNDGKQAHKIPVWGKQSEFYPELYKPFKTFHSRDKTAIRELVKAGIRVIIVSADDSEITKAWAKSCGAEFAHKRIKVFDDKDGIDWNTTAGIGDDTMDLVFLEKCNISFCPSDASFPVRNMDDIIVMQTPGGHGVISEFLYMMQSGEFKKGCYNYQISTT